MSLIIIEADALTADELAFEVCQQCGEFFVHKEGCFFLAQCPGDEVILEAHEPDPKGFRRCIHLPTSPEFAKA